MQTLRNVVPLPALVGHTGLPRHRVYRDVYAGRLPSVQIGSRHYIPLPAARDYVERIKAEA